MIRFAIFYCLFLALFSGKNLMGKTILVENIAAFNRIKTTIVAGDSILLKNGLWKDAALTLHAEGQPNAPVRLLAETPGKVILTGKSFLKLSGTYIEVSGLTFLNCNNEKAAVVEFRAGKDKYAFNCRVSQCVIDNCNPSDRLTESSWIIFYGQHNRFDHNSILRKKNLGTTLIVQLNDELNQQNEHQIDHNYFGPRERGGSNGGETIRIGVSTFSRTSSKTIIEENYFDRCSGEVEVISVKSCDNILRKNTFNECEGSLVLRHGDRNLVEDNYFFGNNKIHTGGVRIINAGHIVRNNVFFNSTGERFRAALTVLNGVPNSPINRYDPVKDVLVCNNFFVNCKNIEWCAGADFERTARPENIVWENNVIYNDKVPVQIGVYDSIDGFTFKNNISNLSGNFPAGSFQKEKISLSPQKEGYLIKYGDKQKTLMAFATLENTGVSRPYENEKHTAGVGKVIFVSAGLNTIMDAVKNASENDTLELTAQGVYLIEKAIIIEKSLTIRSAGAMLQFAGESSIHFFEIENGGSLTLDGLTMQGTSENGTAAGFITAGKSPMIEHYNLKVSNCRFQHLTDSRKHAFEAGKGSMADTIAFYNCVFDDITGDVIDIAAEKDDIGRYNAEYVFIENCLFNKVLYGCINVYRGGNDESTTGPFVYINHCTFNQSSNTELGYVVKLYGVQFSEVLNTIFNNSGRAGRSVWYEDFGWTKHRLDYCNFFIAGKITSFYPGIEGKNNLQTDPMLSANYLPTNPVLKESSDHQTFIGYEKKNGIVGLPAGWRRIEAKNNWVSHYLNK